MIWKKNLTAEVFFQQDSRIYKLLRNFSPALPQATLACLLSCQSKTRSRHIFNRWHHSIYISNTNLHIKCFLDLFTKGPVFLQGSHLPRENKIKKPSLKGRFAQSLQQHMSTTRNQHEEELNVRCTMHRMLAYKQSRHANVALWYQPICSAHPYPCRRAQHLSLNACFLIVLLRFCSVCSPQQVLSLDGPRAVQNFSSSVQNCMPATQRYTVVHAHNSCHPA